MQYFDYDSQAAKNDGNDYSTWKAGICPIGLNTTLGLALSMARICFEGSEGMASITTKVRG
jgi:hypothetical protein